MRLAERTDYALRVLMLLTARQERLTVAEMARWLNVSAHHLTKVVQALQDEGWVWTSRGRGGGVELAADPSTLVVGDVVRAIEPDMDLVECFRTSGGCRIEDSCGLAAVLHSAREAFLSELDRATLSTLVHGHRADLLELTVDLGR
ncbi:MAG: Rrf2 family transcriptional regulator [Phycisphaeraceae bacterium]|nr:Rrf2 family transcriptional regulator [Phycisphaeraceae bacterium]